MNEELDPNVAAELVRPGLWSIRVPLPIRWLRYVLVYVLETSRGPYLIDAGWNTPEAYSALESGLSSIRSSIQEVQGVLVTHVHPDHYGLAGRIREASGAWVALHPLDAALIHERYEDPRLIFERMGEVFEQAGVPSEIVSTLGLPTSQLSASPKPDVLVEDGDRVDVPGWDLTPIWTPGHSPGHLSFFEPRNRLMISGDHLLPRITPNIGFHPATDNPLGDYLDSLERLRSFDVSEVLPAHEYRFLEFQERLTELRLHHEARLGEVVQAIVTGDSTAWNIASKMTWSRSWDRIASGPWRAAVLEALAHLRKLQRSGVVRERPGKPSHWEISNSHSGQR